MRIRVSLLASCVALLTGLLVSGPGQAGVASRQGRVLHAHFDGQTLHIRRSNYLDFTEKNVGNIKLYLRWMMSEPIGDTMLKMSTDKDTSPLLKA